MAPNLFVATQTLFQPHKWFRNDKTEKPKRKTERWEEPVPGLYEYIPRRGWYLIEKDDAQGTTEIGSKGGPVLTITETTPKETIKMNPPVAVRYSKVLKRYLLEPDYKPRKEHGEIENSRGKTIQVGFFRLDDEVSWVNCWDEDGEFIPGPYRLWVFDKKTKRFRHMLRGDDPQYQRSQESSRMQSRQNSVERGQSVRRHSQESRSTEYRAGPGSTHDGQSITSTRANSVRNLTISMPNSTNASRANSRRGSPTRGPLSPRIALDEAGAALRKVQKDRATKELAANQPSAAKAKAQKETAKEPATAAPKSTETVQNQVSSTPMTTSEEHVPATPMDSEGQHGLRRSAIAGA
jgi:hypothetical protein